MSESTGSKVNNNKPKESPILDIVKNGCDGSVTSASDSEEAESMADETDALLEVGDSSIIKSDVEKIILNALVILKQNSSPIACRTHGHAHVGGRAKDLKVFCKEEHPWGSLDIYRDSLEEKVNTSSCFIEEDYEKIRLLQQIASGLEHLHKYERPHGNLEAKSVRLSCDERNHPVIIEANVSFSENSSKIKEKDIRDLGRLFYRVLTNGMRYPVDPDPNDLDDEPDPNDPNRDPDDLISVVRLKCNDAGAAKDLLVKMLSNKAPITIQEILKHPLFWSDEEKIKFITDNFDAISQNKDIIKLIEDEAREFVFDGEWKEELRLTSEDKDKIERFQEEVVNLPDETVSKDKIFQLAGGAKTKQNKNVKFTIYIYANKKLTKVDGIEAKKWKKLTKKSRKTEENGPSVSSTHIHDLLKQKYENIREEDFEIFLPVVLVKKEEDGGYDKESVYDLLRFFRNKKAHYSELDSQAKNYFEALGGYWKFFCARYPNLLTFVYNHKECFAYQQPASL